MDGNGNDSMEVGSEWGQESHSRTPLANSAEGWRECIYRGLSIN